MFRRWTGEAYLAHRRGAFGSTDRDYATEAARAVERWENGETGEGK